MTSPLAANDVQGAAPLHERVEALSTFLRGKRVVALTGAGLSTESGIPDYRGVGARGRPRSSIQGPEFRRSEALRQRYWARAMLGWSRIGAATPNAGHVALARLERAGILSGIITQNVDRLHHRAGSEKVIELHGALEEVRCLGCAVLTPREHLQQRLEMANRAFGTASAFSFAPDGDADIDDETISRFQVVACNACGGTLQPNVVFFGDAVPKPVVDAAFALFDAADVLLVAGTSLAVYSGYRFLRRALEQSKPIAIVNLGPVRGEEHATLRISARTGDVLPAMEAALAGMPPGAHPAGHEAMGPRP